jgi:hypothetical protein
MKPMTASERRGRFTFLKENKEWLVSWTVSALVIFLVVHSWLQSVPVVLRTVVECYT